MGGAPVKLNFDARAYPLWRPVKKNCACRTARTGMRRYVRCMRRTTSRFDARIRVKRRKRPRSRCRSLIYRDARAWRGAELGDARRDARRDAKSRISKRDIFAREREASRPSCKAPPTPSAYREVLRTSCTSNRLTQRRMKTVIFPIIIRSPSGTLFTSRIGSPAAFRMDGRAK